jgi:hypothetical protein
MRFVTALCTAAFMTTLTPAFAEENRTLGTPITSENIVDVLEIQRVVSNLTLGVDSEQWDVVADLLHGDIETTIGEPVNGAPVVKSEDEILTRWRGFYESADTLVIHHVTSNERVYFLDPDNAEVFSKGIIVVENTPAGEFADDGGTLRGYRWIDYEFGVTRTDEGWKANKVNVKYLVQDWTSLPGN